MKFQIEIKSKLIIASILSFNFLNYSQATELASIKHSKQTVFNFPSQNKSDLYLISSKHINRIVTPFVEPSLKIDAIPELQYKTSENVIYLATPKNMRGKILAGFVTERGDESSAIRFMLRPESMPPQEINLKKQRFMNYSVNKMARRFEALHPRKDTIIKILRKLAFGELPKGYSILPPSSNYLPGCVQLGFEFEFFRGQLVSGGDYMVAIGTVKNTTKNTAEFLEKNCYSENVVAVSAYPKTRLEHNQSSEVFVMFYREKFKQNKKVRQSLLRG